MWKYMDWLACILLIVGGLNWGLVGFFGFNLVTFMFGGSMLAKGVYGLVGLSAIYKLYCCMGCLTGCSSGGCCSK